MDLEGKRIGVAYYTATTSIWVQCLIGNAGVDPATIRWIVTDPPLVDRFRDPAHVRRAPTKTLLQLLQEGDVDAIVTASPPTDPKYGSVAFETSARDFPMSFPDMQSHHMLVCRSTLTRERPQAIREIWRMLLEARSIGVQPGSSDAPYGIDANRAHLDAVIAACFKLRLIDRRPAVDELFDDMAASLPASQ